MIASLLLTAAAVAQEPAASVPVLDHEALNAELHRLAAASAHVQLVSIGRSRAGRAIEGLRFGPEGDGKPVVLLVANLDGPRLFTSAVALHHCRRLAEGYGSDERITALLDAAQVVILPRANPDAAEMCLGDLRHEFRGSGADADDDRDGSRGEDAPADINGDGIIATLRYEDPEGTWIPDPTDPRAMVQADPLKGQRGMYRLVIEGLDADGDEEIAEDPPMDAQVNRNFASGWQQYRPAAGVFPTDEPEALALSDFCVTSKGLALVVTYDELDNLVKAPKTVKDDARPVLRVPPEGVLASDGDLLKALGERYREATGSKAEGGAENGGTFQRFAYDHRGLLCLDVTLWDLPQEDPPKPEAEGGEGEEETSGESKKDKQDADKPSDDAKHLAWIDAQGEAEAWRFLDWTPFEHPTLGPVEIGGFAPFARLTPPTAEWESIADSHLDFLLGLGELLPRVEVVECTIEALGSDLWRVEAAVENRSFLPLQSRSARRTRTMRPARVQLVLPDAATLIAGTPRSLVSTLDGSGGRFEASWLVQGPEGMEVGVSVDTDNAGVDSRKAEVKP